MRETESAMERETEREIDREVKKTTLFLRNIYHLFYLTFRKSNFIIFYDCLLHSLNLSKIKLCNIKSYEMILTNNSLNYLR